MLDEKAPTSLYYQLKEILAEKIKNNEWPLDSKIPTERELCEIYKVSRITVRQALSALETEGYLYRKQGKGTFVTAPKIEQRLSDFYSFSEELRKLGYTPTTKVLEFTVIPAEDRLIHVLAVKKGALTYCIKRLRLANDEPFAIEISYVPHDLCPGLRKEQVSANGLYNTMKEEYKLVPGEAIETFEAVAVNANEAAHLNVNKNSPALLLERQTFAGERIVEYCKSIIRGDRYKYRVVLR